MEKELGNYIHTVGDLRKAIEGIPDKRPICFQLRANDGQVAYIYGKFCPKVPAGTIAVMTVGHPQLQSLAAFRPNID